MLTRENIEGTRVIRAFSRQEEEVEEFKDAVNDIAESSIKVGKLSAILNPLSFMVMNLGIVAITWFGGVRINIGDMTQGELTAFTNYMTQILLALLVLANLIVIFTKAIASANRVQEIFELASENSDGSETPNENRNCETILSFENVSFAYEGRSRLLGK